MGKFETEIFLYLNGMRKYMPNMIHKAKYGLYMPEMNPNAVASIIQKPRNSKELSFACDYYELVSDVSKSKELLSDKTVISFDKSKFKEYANSYIKMFILLFTNFYEHKDELFKDSVEEPKKNERTLKLVISELVNSTDSDEYKNLCCEGGIIMLYHSHEFLDFVIESVKDLPVIRGNSSDYFIDPNSYDKRVHDITVLSEYVVSKCLFDLYFFGSEKGHGDITITDSDIDNGRAFIKHFRNYIKKLINERKKD